MQKSQTLVASLQEQSSQLADTNAVYKDQIGKMEEKLTESKQEILKGNDIIQKQQADQKQLKQKLKLKVAQIEDLERAVQGKQSDVQSKSNEMNTVREQ